MSKRGKKDAAKTLKIDKEFSTESVFVKPVLGYSGVLNIGSLGPINITG